MRSAASAGNRNSLEGVYSYLHKRGKVGYRETESKVSCNLEFWYYCQQCISLVYGFVTVKLEILWDL